MGIFDSVAMRKPKYNKFDLSHERKFGLKMGDMVPIMVQEVLPGDSFRVKSEIFMRLAPMLAPMMHRVNVRTEYFFVPNRLVWTEWEDFITGGEEGTTTPVAPYLLMTSDTKEYFDVGKLSDFMGIPPMVQAEGVTNPAQISALPFRAYQLIYNEWYRDQNLQEALPITFGSGQVVPDDQVELLLTMRRCCWEKDYFTSALPFAQRGPEVLVPIAGVAEGADITYKEIAKGVDGGSGIHVGTMKINGLNDVTDTDDHAIGIDNIESIEVQNTSTTVSDFARSVALQRFYEANARGGARYIEQIKSHFNVISSDARLQRPEFLGGGMQRVVVSEVLSTFQQEDTDPQGNMAGHGISVGNTNGFKRRFEEHGYVIGIVRVLPRTAYQQGIPRHFLRADKFDYFWPEFANIGEQPIKNGEIMYDQGQSAGHYLEEWAYQSRYADYKYCPSTVHGQFRTSLGYWHMGRIFDAFPELTAGFVEADPTQRVFAVEDAPEVLYCQLYNKVDALRPMPYHSIPRLDSY